MAHRPSARRQRPKPPLNTQGSNPVSTVSDSVWTCPDTVDRAPNLLKVGPFRARVKSAEVRRILMSTSPAGHLAQRPERAARSTLLPQFFLLSKRRMPRRLCWLGLVGLVQGCTYTPQTIKTPHTSGPERRGRLYYKTHTRRSPPHCVTVPTRYRHIVRVLHQRDPKRQMQRHRAT